MVSILASSTVVSIGNRIKVEAISGVAPYVFSLPAGGDGGSITSEGIYTAPLVNTKGFQKILVTDDAAATYEITVSILTHLQLVCEIIQNQLGLDPDQVYIYNQKINIPPDNRMYVAVGVNSVKIISSNMKMTGDEEILSTNSQMNLKIDIVSKTLEALNRKEEVVSSFRSIISQRIQNANMFKLAEIPNSFNDLSNIEGSSIPYRFNMGINMLYFTKVVKDAESYDGSNMLPNTIEVHDEGALLDTSGDVV